MPVDEKDIAPIAQPLPGRRNCSGKSTHIVFIVLGTVPWEEKKNTFFYYFKFYGETGNPVTKDNG